MFNGMTHDEINAIAAFIEATEQIEFNLLLYSSADNDSGTPNGKTELIFGFKVGAERI